MLESWEVRKLEWMIFIPKWLVWLFFVMELRMGFVKFVWWWGSAWVRDCVCGMRDGKCVLFAGIGWLFSS